MFKYQDSNKPKKLNTLPNFLPTDPCADPRNTDPRNSSRGHQHWLMQHLSVITLLNLQSLLRLFFIDHGPPLAFTASSYPRPLNSQLFFFISVRSSWRLPVSPLIHLTFPVWFSFSIPSILRYTFPHPSSPIHILAIFSNLLGLSMANIVFLMFSLHDPTY